MYLKMLLGVRVGIDKRTLSSLFKVKDGGSNVLLYPCQNFPSLGVGVHILPNNNSKIEGSSYFLSLLGHTFDLSQSHE